MLGKEKANKVKQETFLGWKAKKAKCKLKTIYPKNSTHVEEHLGHESRSTLGLGRDLFIGIKVQEGRRCKWLLSLDGKISDFEMEVDLMIYQQKNKECMLEQWDIYTEKNSEMFNEAFTSYWQDEQL